MSDNEIILTGDITDFEIFLSAEKFGERFEREMQKAMVRACLYLIKEIKQRIRERKYTKNTYLTLALVGRKGKDIPLLKIKNMVDAIAYELKNSFTAEVGFIKNSLTTGGVKSPPHSMYKVVELMHTGYVIKVTPKMRAAIFAALAAQRTKKGNVKRGARQALTFFRNRADPSGSTQAGAWRVPPRPFLTDVFKDPKIQTQLRAIWRDGLERLWIGQRVKDGEHKER
jgi:hypothetical protein